MRNEDDAPENFESDGMRPDAEDRGSRRERSKPSRGFALSKQHIKLGIGVLVLLLLIYLVSSALNSLPGSKTAGRARLIWAQEHHNRHSLRLTAVLPPAQRLRQGRVIFYACYASTRRRYTNANSSSSGNA